MKNSSEVWHALQSFEFDVNQPKLPFVIRLARDNGWSAEYAQRVVEEYRRFLFLSIQTSHVVCPSEAVDQAWHFHLCDTKSYWTRLCQGVLGRPLHHTPSQGGRAETEIYKALYAETLVSYQQLFGEAPPLDIWPSVAQRFAPQRFQRVDRLRYFVLPKRVFTNFGVLALSGASLTGCAGLLATQSEIPVSYLIFGGLFILVLICIIFRKNKGGGSGCGGSCGAGCGGCGGGCGGD